MTEKPDWVGIIHELMQRMSSTDVTELDLRRGDVRIRLRRAAGTLVSQQITGSMDRAGGQPTTFHKVAAPLTGIFLAAPDPASPPYVSVGDLVEPETVVGLIETMKVFNEVAAECRGRVTSILVQPGQLVHAGEPLFEVYSPELLASQEEYLRARQSAAEFSKSALPEVQRGGADLAMAARRRLELFDVPSEFLQRLDESGTAQRTVTFKAPFAGFVTGKNVVAGQRIEPGMELLTVTDMSQVWVIAQVFEAEARVAQPGRAARVTLPYDSNVTLSGRIAFVYPTLDAETRALKVRLEFPNPRGALKPGMFVNVELGVDSAAGIVVPDSAVLDSGTRQLVFIELSPGRFAARDVSVALRADGQAVIRSGLSAGEHVAVSANFLLDSESRLRNAARTSGRQPQEQ